jgi:hypothetical protein
MRAKQVAVRTRIGEDHGPVSVTEFIERCQQEIATHGAAKV